MVDFSKLFGRERPAPPKVPGLTIGVSGHRPEKLWSKRDVAGGIALSHDGYEWGNPLRQRLRQEVRAATERLVASAERDRYDAAYRDSYLRRVRWQNGYGDGESGAERWRDLQVLCLHGGALGTDQDVAGEWRRMGLPYVVVVPFPGQETRWPAESQRVYRKVVECAAGVYECLSADRAPKTREEASKALLRRNEVLCCMTDELVSVWDHSNGGTAHCTRWWDRVHCGAHITRLDPREWRGASPLVVHCQREPYDVYVGRGRCPKTGQVGPWGNPFSHLPESAAKFRVVTRDEAIARYEDWLLKRPDLVARLPELRGKVLGCWCKPLPCHGDVLVRLANQ